MTHPFLLTKWYLDMVDSSGRGLVAYQADLSWGPVKLRYDGIIPIGEVNFKATGNFSSQSTLREANDTISWSAESSTGTWQRRFPEVNCELLNGEAGFVNWHCVQPSSEVNVKVGDAEFQGLGYAEKLEMNIAPWKLPIKELLWGRFVSKQNTMVWIHWSGPEPRMVLFFNGKKIMRASITSLEVAFDSFHLTLPDTVVRRGSLGESLFAGADRLASLFPRSILSLQEEKWCGQAELKNGSTTVDRGTVIHECVRWP